MKYILILILLWLLTRCASFTEPTRALSLRADFFVSTITKDTITCHKENCVLSIADDMVQFYTEKTNLVISELAFNLHREAIGSDRHGKQWRVVVDNMRREPYLLLLKSDTAAILVGYKCY